MNSVNRRGPCQEHGCYCQEFWPGLKSEDFCDACEHDELFHRRWEVHEERADRRGYGACRWAKVQKDDEGFAVLDESSNPIVLRACKCTEFGPSRVDPGAGKCRACNHHKAYHRLLLGASSSVGIMPATSLPHASSVATASRVPSAPPYEEQVKEQVATTVVQRGKDKVDAVPPPAPLLIPMVPPPAAGGSSSGTSLVPKPWAVAVPGEHLLQHPTLLLQVQ